MCVTPFKEKGKDLYYMCMSSVTEVLSCIYVGSFYIRCLVRLLQSSGGLSY